MIVTILITFTAVAVGIFTIIGVLSTVVFFLEQRDNRRRLEQDREEELLMGQKYRTLNSPVIKRVIEIRG